MTRTDQNKKQFLFNIGYDVLSEKLDNNLEVKCIICGMPFKRCFKNFNLGHIQCPNCYLFSKVKEIESLGFKVISGIEGQNIVVECPKGHISNKKFLNVKRCGNILCTECERIEKLSFIENLGFKVISQNLGSDMEVLCHNGHKFKKPFALFKKGYSNCPTCEWDERYNFYKNYGFTLLEFKAPNVKLKCKNDHIFSRQHNNFILGNTTCPICEKENKIKQIRLWGFIVLSDDLNKNLEVMCLKGHTFRKRFDHLKENPVCPHCHPNRSVFEINVEKELKALKIDFKANDWSVLKDKELDFYLPDYNLAIECNGDYWHSTEFRNDNSHLNKYLLCKEKGIRLIQIPESEWKYNKEFFINLIKCYLENGDFTQFLEGDRFNLMYLSESLFNNYDIEPPVLVNTKVGQFWNCGYGVLRKS